MIQRDGTCTSLWQDNSTEYHQQNTPLKSSYDVAIVGGGITGITTALMLQASGKSCIVLEANNLCFGTTGGTTAHLNTLLDTPYYQLIRDFGKERAGLVAQAAKDAITLIERNISSHAIACSFERTPARIFSQNDIETKELEEIARGCRDVNVEAVFTDSLPLNFLYEKVLLVTDQAKFNPIDYVYGLAQAFEQAGGTIRQYCRVTGMNKADSIVLETSEGAVEARDLIYATHVPPGASVLHMRCVPYRSYAIAAILKYGVYPRGLTYDMKDPYHYYRSQQVNGTGYLIAGGYDHKTAHEENPVDCFRALEAHVRQHF